MRYQTLSEAADLIGGQRAADYGDAAENFAHIAAGWSIILGADVTAHEVALCMDWLKTCRLIGTPTHHDSWVDKAGYTALGSELAQKSQPSSGDSSSPYSAESSSDSSSA